MNVLVQKYDPSDTVVRRIQKQNKTKNKKLTFLLFAKTKSPSAQVNAQINAQLIRTII